MSGPETPQYTKYRARPSFPGRRQKGPSAPQRGLRDRLPRGDGRPGRIRGGFSGRRLLKYLAVALAAWIGVSILLFLVSAQIQQGKVSDATDNALDGGGLPLGSPTTILVLGSDQRPEGTQEAGASTSGPSRSDSILLVRTGGGANTRMAIARDTLVDIPGAGRQKINAAYAIGGAPLAIRTIREFTGVEINHVIEVSFSEFPDLIDAMGGISYTGGCVVARINGGYRNGGVTVRIRGGERTHLDGEKALALARARQNECNPDENDLTRARRQQKILAAMKSRIISPGGFGRLPWIGWQTPRSFRTDMGGPTLMTVFGWMSAGGSPATVVLGTPSGEVPDSLKQRMVERFLDG
jgi:LCP family protein required for cell wall assembly